MNESSIVTDAQYYEFKSKLRGIIISIVIGFIIGGIIGLIIAGDDGYQATFFILFGIVFAGVPYAWKLIPFWSMNVTGIMLKVIIALVGGWIITPISFIYNLIQYIRYGKRMQNHMTAEQQVKDNDVKRENDNADRIVNAVNNK